MADEFVVAGSDSPELLEPGEHAFDAVSFLVEARITAVLEGSIRPWGDDRLGPDLAQQLVKMVGVVGLVGKDGGGSQAVEQGRSLDHVASMAGRQDEADGQSKGIDTGMDLGPEAAP